MNQSKGNSVVTHLLITAACFVVIIAGMKADHSNSYPRRYNLRTRKGRSPRADPAERKDGTRRLDGMREKSLAKNNLNHNIRLTLIGGGLQCG